MKYLVVKIGKIKMHTAIIGYDTSEKGTYPRREPKKTKCWEIGKSYDSIDAAKSSYTNKKGKFIIIPHFE